MSRFISRGWCRRSALAGLVATGAGMVLASSSSAVERTATGRRASSAKAGEQGGGETGLRQLEKKLDAVLANQATILSNQATILQRFDAVMEELRIVKVRATAHSGS